MYPIYTLTNEQEDDLYDSFVEFHNSLLAKGYKEVQILEIMVGWVRSTKTTAEEHGHPTEGYSNI